MQAIAAIAIATQANQNFSNTKSGTGQTDAGPTNAGLQDTG